MSILCSMVGATFGVAAAAEVIRLKKGIVVNGNTQISTAQSKFGGSSALFDGTSDYLSVSPGGFNVGTGDITVEFWVRHSAVNDQQVYCDFRAAANNHLIIYITSGNKIEIYDGGSAYTGTTSLTTNTWYHIALSRSGTSLKVFLNGIQEISATNSRNLSDNSAIVIGSSWEGTSTNSVNGYMDEFRVSNTARYTANFTEPTQPFVNDDNTLLLLHMNGTNTSTFFLDDNGVSPTAYTSDAVAFDGTGDYYTSGALSSSVIADAKIVLMCINFYWSGGNNLQHLVNLRLGTGSGDLGFWSWINGGRSQFKFVYGNGSVPGSIYENTENSLTSNAWNQIVFWVDTTSSANCQIWVNGNLKAHSNDGFPTNVNFNWTNTATELKIGQKNSNQTGDGADFNGRMSQVYISAAASFPGIDYFWQQGKPRDLGTNGRATALLGPYFYHYGGTSTFTTNQGNFAAYTLTANGNVSTVANNSIYQTLRTQKSVISISGAEIDTAQSKFSGSSLLMPNDGAKYLTVKHSPDFLTGVNAFCVEGWFRPLSAVDPGDGVGSRFFYFKGINTAGGIGLGISTDGIRFRGPGTDDLVYTGSVSNTTFSHIAFVWDGTNKSIYLNGTRVSTTTAHAINLTDLTDIQIGYNSTRFGFNGHIDELRHSKVARYSGASLTQPTTAFTNDADTLLLLHANGFDGCLNFVDDNQIKYFEPTAALTDDSSTELLLHMNGSAGGTTFTDDNSSGRTAKTLTRTGVTTETAQFKFGTASMLSSTASAQGLVVTGTTNLVTWHNTDYCVEAWIYPTSFTDISGPTYAGIPVGKVVGNQSRTGSSSYWGFGPTSTGALCWYMWDPSVGSRGFVTTTTPITLNTWHHIVVQHTLGNRLLTFFCNGNKIGEWGVTSHGNLAVDNSTGVCIGGYDNKGFPGYIDEVRISRSVRY